MRVRRKRGAIAIGTFAGLGLLAGLLAPPVVASAQPLSSYAAGLRPLAVFDDYVNGSLSTQGTWHVNTPGASDGAIVSAEVPASYSGKTMVNQLERPGDPVQYRGNAYAGLGDLAIAEGATGTVFWEFSTDRLAGTDVSLGLSIDASPGLGADTTGDAFDLDDFGPQLRVDERGLVAQDGSVERVVDSVQVTDDTIYRIWLTADNAADTFQVHLAAPGEEPALATAGDQDTFAFRVAGDLPLSTFLHLNDPADPPTANSYLDNIYVAPAETTTEDPSPAYTEVLDFEDYSTGPVDGQDGWTAAPQGAVVTDAADPENHVLEMTGSNLTAHRAIPPVQKGDTGTLFFRFHRDANVDTSLGLTDVDAPATFGDSRAYANSQNSADLGVRDGGTFRTVGRWSADAWQCVWLVTDHETNQVAMYSRGGPYPVTTRLPVDEELMFDFRTATAGALDRFFMINGNSAGRLTVDDIAVDPTSVNLRVPSGDAGDCEVVDAGQLPVTTPVPQTAQPTDLELTLEPFAQLPVTSGSTGARINFLSEVPGFEDRYAVPDLNGPLNLIVDGSNHVYLDAPAELPDFVRSPSLGTGLGFVAFHPEFAQNGKFYTAHTEAGAALTGLPPTLPAPDDVRVHGVITEWTADDPAATEFSGTHRQVLRIGYSRFLHGLQQISFNPYAEPGADDYGLLYIGSGDGDAVPNFSDQPQDKGKPHGKILRIDPAGTDGAGGGYGIPPGNPFVGESGALGEVYAMGFRNPHRFSWDPVTGRMFAGMIGEQSIDSIYEVQAGDNFGWNQREGAFVFKWSDPSHVYPLPENDADLGYTYPVMQIGRNTGVSLVGGFVYRGDLDALRGKYLFGDIVSGEIRFTEAADLRRGEEQPPFYDAHLADENGDPTTMRALTGASRVDLRFGQDAEGELYVLAKSTGEIWRIAGATGNEVADPGCEFGPAVVTDVAGAENWEPLTPSKWRFENDEIIQVERGTAPSGPRRPFEYAVLTGAPEFTSVRYEAQVRIDEPVSRNDRDVILVFNYRSPTKFYYVHLSQDNTIYPHNGIFVVDDADRRRIDDQWDGTVGAPAAIDDLDWHDVRVDYCAESGRIEVYLDGLSTPLMTATDAAFSGGRLGFGSFDNYGRVRQVTATGTPVPGTDPASDDATLSSLKVDGQPIAGFDPEKLTYSVAVDKKTDIPEITAAANDAAATVEVTQAASLPGTAQVRVLAEDGSTSLAYTVQLTEAKKHAVRLVMRVDAGCVDGRAHLAVQVENLSRRAVDIRVTTPYGAETFLEVAPRMTVSSFVDTESNAITPGKVRAGGYSWTGGSGYYLGVDGRYGAVDCGA